MHQGQSDLFIDQQEEPQQQPDLPLEELLGGGMLHLVRQDAVKQEQEEVERIDVLGHLGHEKVFVEGCTQRSPLVDGHFRHPNGAEQTVFGESRDGQYHHQQQFGNEGRMGEQDRLQVHQQKTRIADEGGCRGQQHELLDPSLFQQMVG